jgi:cyclopropane-fatty-acyl-phospholipid synthase
MVRSDLSALDRLLFQRLRQAIGEAPIRIVVGDTDGISGPAGKPVATVVIPDRRTLAGLVLNREVTFGEAYSQGRIRVEGDLVQMLEALLRPTRTAADKSWYGKLTSRWLEWIQANTLKGSANNIHRHYDLTADFYKLWLDSRLVYTCAYFPDESTPLEQAQLAKMDYVCRKVQLRPGDSVVEAGCGWGAQALHIAKHYGARVRAFNISKEQIRLARDRAKQEGLTSRVEFIEDDYRNISGRYDVFLSVGMLEHVGRENFEELGRVIHRTIGDSGRGLLHFIGRNRPHAFSPWIRKRIFPGAYVPALAEAAGIFEPWDFSVFDVENLRWHYAKTLEHWLARFERATKWITEMYGDEFVRAWRLYLAGSLASFRIGALQLFQVVFAGANYRQIPWTRAHLYREESSPATAAKWIHATSSS